MEHDRDEATAGLPKGPGGPMDAPATDTTEPATADAEEREPAGPPDSAATEIATPDGPPPSGPIPRAIRGRRLAVVGAAVLVTLWLGATLGPPVREGLHKLWPSAASGAEGAAGEAGQAQYYTCGMHPWVILPKPGTCPICGMELVPLDPAKFSGEVTINPVVAQNIGVRVQEVKRGPAGGDIRTVGIVAYDETRLGDVNLKVSGWIEKLFVDYLGAQVRKGQPLFTLYSPDLFAAEQEYLLAYRAAKGRAGSSSGALTDGTTQQLLESAGTKLAYFDIGPAQIAELEQRGTPSKTMTIFSPLSGVVTEKHAVEGMKVSAGTMAYRVADLSRVWVMATVYEYQTQHVSVGQKAKMSLSYSPGKELEGKVVYIYPYLDDRTRQITVRLEFPNPDRALKPGMYATVQLEGAESVERVLVPRAAVIDTGERQVAFVSRGEGHFEPRAVRMGGETGGGEVEILEGLQPGELVVTSGQFLIDSEARMREALAKMIRGTPPAAEAPAVAATQAPSAALPPAASTALGAGLDAYLTIGDALAADSTHDTGVAARALAEAMDVMVAVDVPGQPHFWHQHTQANAVRERSLALANAATVDDVRRAYADLSAALADLVRSVGVPAAYGKKLEELHCPMYPDSKTGSVWIQPAGAVRNPFFGKTMLTCSDRRQALPTVATSGTP